MNEGYGTSEAGGISSNGVKIHGVGIKLVDVPEMGYTSKDKPLPRGGTFRKTF